jgi:hypothetical protein
MAVNLGLPMPLKGGGNLGIPYLCRRVKVSSRQQTSSSQRLGRFTNCPDLLSLTTLL